MKFNTFKVEELVKQKIIEKPIDGNHGGIHPKGSDFISSGIPFIMASDLERGNINFKNCKFISIEQSKTLKKGFAKTGDVLITHKATIGRTAIVPPMDYPYIVLSPQVTYYRVKDNSKLNPNYLKFYFDSYEFQALFMNWAGAGSTRAYLGITAQLKLPVTLPDISIQNKISNMISPFNELINVNVKEIKLIEKIAQAIFKHWFIDFEFPNEDGLPYKSNGGNMVKSELGEIPEGWKIVTIGDVCNANQESLSKKDKWDFINYLDTGNITRNSIDNIQLIDGRKDKVPSRAKRKIKRNDIVYSTVRPNQQHYGLIKEPLENMIVSTGFVVLSSKGLYSNDLIYLWLTQEEILNSLQAIAEQSTSAYPSIKPEDILSLKTPLPSKRELDMLTNVIEIQNKLIWNNQQENKKLSEIQNTLLPKLLSGEIQIPDESVVG